MWTLPVREPALRAGAPGARRHGRFDAAFFGLTPREAELTDPQQRLFLECCWEALEQRATCRARSAGADRRLRGAGLSTYLLGLSRPAWLTDEVGTSEMLMGNDKDCLATAVAYKLNLRGPASTVQTACSTSLVAVHLACQACSTGECDVALAGGVSIRCRSGGRLSVPGRASSP